MKRDSMIFFRSMADSLRKLEPLDFMLMMLGIIDYAMDDVEPEFSNPLFEALWVSFKPQIDANKRKFDAQVENGKKGGRPKKPMVSEPITIGFENKNPTKPKKTQENPNKPNETQPKPYMRNEICEMRNVLNNTSSSCACAREKDENGSHFLPDDVYEKIMNKVTEFKKNGRTT